MRDTMMRRTRSASPVPEFHWTLAKADPKPRAETLLDLSGLTGILSIVL
jgi:hypothetical protein